MHVDEDWNRNWLGLCPFSSLGECVSFCPCLLVQVYSLVALALVDLARDGLFATEFGLELLQCLRVVYPRPLFFVVEWRERVRLLDLTTEAQIPSVMLGEEGLDFDARTRLEHIQGEHVRRCEVGARHVVLVDISHVQDPLVRLEKILSVVEGVNVSPQQTLSLKWSIHVLIID